MQRNFNRRKPAPLTQGAASRAAAAAAVAAVEAGASLISALPAACAKLEDRDQAAAAETAYGTLRHRRLLNATLQPLLEHKIPAHFAAVRSLLLCALYQISFMRTPPHAAVSAAVSACGLLHARACTGLVNAVLRRYLREGANLARSEDPFITYSFPEWLGQKLMQAYPEEGAQLLAACNERAPLFLRVELSRISLKEYGAQLDAAGLAWVAVGPQAPAAIRLLKPCRSRQIPGFTEGLVSIQDLSAQCAAPLLQPESGLSVLDTCAAPGGKTAHILDLCPSVKLTALEVDEKRVSDMRSNLTRLKRRVIVKNLDAADLSQLDHDFDRILVDAPCSGTGVIRRHPDIKWLRREKDLPALLQKQAEILDAAFSKLKPQGILVYTTCSLLPEENIGQYHAFLQRHSDAKPLPFSLNGKTGACLQQLPSALGGDGFFYARFTKA